MRGRAACSRVGSRAISASAASSASRSPCRSPMNQSGSSGQLGDSSTRDRRRSPRWSSNSIRAPPSRVEQRLELLDRCRACGRAGRRARSDAAMRSQSRSWTSTTGGIGGASARARRRRPSDAGSAGASRARASARAPAASRAAIAAGRRASRRVIRRRRRPIRRLRRQPTRAVSGSLLMPLALRPAASTSPSLRARGAVSGAPLTSVSFTVRGAGVTIHCPSGAPLDGALPVVPELGVRAEPAEHRLADLGAHADLQGLAARTSRAEFCPT